MLRQFYMFLYIHMLLSTFLKKVVDVHTWKHIRQYSEKQENNDKDSTKEHLTFLLRFKLYHP